MHRGKGRKSIFAYLRRFWHGERFNSHRCVRGQYSTFEWSVLMQAETVQLEALNAA